MPVTTPHRDGTTGPQSLPVRPAENLLLALQRRAGNAATAALLGARPTPGRSGPSPALVVQRDAARWQLWANDVSNGIGTGHVVEDSAGFLAVNGAIDVSESFLDYLQAKELDELKAILTLSKKIKDGTVTNEQIRLRMRVQVPATTTSTGSSSCNGPRAAGSGSGSRSGANPASSGTSSPTWSPRRTRRPCPPAWRT